MAKTQKQTQKRTKKSDFFAGVDDTTRENFERVKQQLREQQVRNVDGFLADALYIEQEFQLGRRRGLRAVAELIVYYDKCGREAGSADTLMDVARKLGSLAASLKTEAHQSEAA